MTGANWDGSEMCWRHLPQQYGAIHFHEDDIYDFEWETDFSFWCLKIFGPGFTVFDSSRKVSMTRFLCLSVRRGINGLPVYVYWCRPFSYTVYGNHARPDYEPSWLDRNEAWNAYPWNPAEYHTTDVPPTIFTRSKGICHASHRRPLFNLRPGYLTFGANACSDCVIFRLTVT
ncbi:MAG: hypothetical protein CM1200mP18_19160 [Gammaproteobacteria bacterium]|nr:MAG: hypothetical protein CM1200mP18_19160 [Gammaproteobacteria bacterium]